jgi:GDPmannose 4,6-dehydratase
MPQTAMITGVTGQDGFHLTRLLLSKGYEVFGLINGQRNSRLEEFQSLFPEVKLLSGDLTDFSSIQRAIDAASPQEVYNLGAISFVGLSFEQPELTANVTGLGALRVLQACRLLDSNNNIRIYQASSSEMFGKVRETPQNEQTPFHPRSPYGVAKTFAHYSCVNYREAYGMHISCGILFNHEGEFRGHEFVTRKITSTLAKIANGSSVQLNLGSLTPKRDWGYAGDYVEAMWRMLQQEIPDDYVIATGETHSVEDFLKLAFLQVGLKGSLKDYLSHDPRMLRPAEVDLLIGDATKAKEKLGWEPKTSFSQLVSLMVENDLELESNHSGR